MGNRSSKGSAGGQDEDAGSGLFLSPELQGEGENRCVKSFVLSAARRAFDFDCRQSIWYFDLYIHSHTIYSSWYLVDGVEEGRR